MCNLVVIPIIGSGPPAPVQDNSKVSQVVAITHLENSYSVVLHFNAVQHSVVWYSTVTSTEFISMLHRVLC